MESKGLMRSQGMTAQEAFKLVASCDDLEKALDGAMYVQVGTSSRFSINMSLDFCKHWAFGWLYFSFQNHYICSVL